jgi:hypothetical protein
MKTSSCDATDAQQFFQTREFSTSVRVFENCVRPGTRIFGVFTIRRLSDTPALKKTKQFF